MVCERCLYGNSCIFNQWKHIACFGEYPSSWREKISADDEKTLRILAYQMIFDYR